MAISHSLRRGAATTGSGVLVVGAGLTVGLLAADMQAQFAAEDALRTAAASAVDPAPDLVIPRPVVRTRIVEEHVTPEPVVVHRTVRRTVVGPAQAAPRASSGGSGRPARPAPRASSSKPSRTVVAPAPAAPAPTRHTAPSTSTSKTS